MDRLTPPHPGPARSPFLSAPADRLPDGGVAGLRSFSLRAPSMTDEGSAENLVQARYELHRALDSNDPDKARAWLRDWGESLLRGADDGRAAEEAYLAEAGDEPEPVDTERVEDALDDAEHELVTTINAVAEAEKARTPVAPNDLQGGLRDALSSLRKARTELDKL